MDYHTRYSKYSAGVDVRATYNHLPCQFFWTWLTGKDGRHRAPRTPQQTLLREWQLWAQVAWSWSVILLSVAGGIALFRSNLHAAIQAPLYVAIWILVVNRTRGLLHTFHYTNHGASIADMRRARWIGKYFMSIPILHTAWDNYHAIHARDHHSSTYLCTANDPDEIFMMDHGFHPAMREGEFWSKLVLAPFHPRAIWAHIRFRLEQNFLRPAVGEIIPRLLFWVLFFGAATYFGLLTELILFYLFPLLIVTQFSSWLQHTTEHLWFARKPNDMSPFIYYASLTWGRFQGRPHPGRGHGLRHGWRRLVWWLSVFVIDLPIRLFSFMQDLPSHDFHHRSPRVNFWSIARERAANEGRPSKFGPMAETWGMMESWRILRDHLCRGEHDPFGLYAWDQANRRETPRSAAAA